MSERDIPIYFERLIHSRAVFDNREVNMMLEGDGVNLVLLEKDRLLNLKYWLNDPRCTILRRSFTQVTIGELE